MFQLENLYFDFTTRLWRLCQMWCLGYHYFYATILPSTGRNGMPTFNMVRVHTDCRLFIPKNRDATDRNRQSLMKCSIAASSKGRSISS